MVAFYYNFDLGYAARQTKIFVTLDPWDYGMSKEMKCVWCCLNGLMGF